MTITATPVSSTNLNDQALVALYRLGALTESLRDSTGALLRAATQHAGAGAVADCGAQYIVLRDELAGALPYPAGQDLLAWTPNLDGPFALGDVHIAASALAAYVGTLLAQDAFVAGWRQRAQQIDAQGLLGSASAPGTAAVPTLPARPPAPGQYL